MELIERGNLIKNLRKAWGDETMVDADGVIMAIEDEPTIEPEIKCIAKVQIDEDRMKEICYKAVQNYAWVPLSEGLPEEERDVLTTHLDVEGNAYVVMHKFRTGRFIYNWNFRAPESKVIAWMYLPPAWIGEEHE